MWRTKHRVQFLELAQLPRFQFNHKSAGCSGKLQVSDSIRTTSHCCVVVLIFHSWQFLKITNKSGWQANLPGAWSLGVNSSKTQSKKSLMLCTCPQYIKQAKYLFASGMRQWGMPDSCSYWEEPPAGERVESRCGRRWEMRQTCLRFFMLKDLVTLSLISAGCQDLHFDKNHYTLTKTMDGSVKHVSPGDQDLSPMWNW